MLEYYEKKYGEVVIRQRDRKFTIQIRNGNCLAVMVHIRKATPEELKEDPEGKYFHTLYNFFCDEAHIKRILKNGGKLLSDEVVSIKLNLFYKNCYTLLKYFVQEGHKVVCYYKEEK